MRNVSRLLIVEDDKNLGFLLTSQLEENGFITDLATEGDAGLTMFNTNQYALCILDIMMPKKDGLTLAKEIRALSETVPIIFLTARNLKSDKIIGYEIGCDDYITKPFDIDELVYKIQAILKRTTDNAIVNTDQIEVGELTLKIKERSLSNQSQHVLLSQKETILLQLFFDNPNEVISRKTLLIEGWGNDDYFTSKSLDVYLTKIRKVLAMGKSLKLTNIHGYGYLLNVSLRD